MELSVPEPPRRLRSNCLSEGSFNRDYHFKSGSPENLTELVDINDRNNKMNNLSMLVVRPELQTEVNVDGNI